MSLHFSADLYLVVKNRTAMLYWIMDPAVQGVVIAYDLGGNQVLLHQYDVGNSIFTKSEDADHIVAIDTSANVIYP
jgi:hypothetical protein